MIKVENEYYVRFILLLIKGGTFIMRKIALREVQLLNTDLDTLLVSSQDTIKTLKNNGAISNAQFNSLNLQNSCAKSDISKWDISILSTVLLHIIQQNISAQEKLGIKKIRDMRNGFQAHHPDGSMDRHTYNLKWTELTLIINTLSYGFPETDKEEINEIILGLAREPLDINLAVEQLKQSDIRDDFYDSVQRNLQSIQELRRTIESGFKTCHEGYVDIKKRIINLQVRLDQQGKYVRTIQTVRGLVHISSDEQEAVDEAEQVLLQASRDSLNDIQSDSYHRGVRDEFENLRQPLQERGLDIKNVEKGCIVYTITYTSLEDLLKLIDFFESQLMKQCLIGIAKALGMVVGRDIQLIASISQNSLEDILKLTEFSDTFIEKDNSGKVLNFEMECTGATGLLHAWDLFQEGKITNKLDALSKSLSETIGKPVKLSTSLDMKSINDAIRKASEEIEPDMTCNEDCVQDSKTTPMDETQGDSGSKREHIAKGVDHLCEEIQEKEIVISNESYTIPNRRCDQSSIPENWIKEEVKKVNMASAGIGRQSSLCVILVKVGTPVATALFEKRVKDLTPTDYNPSPWTVDEFLLANKPTLRSLKLHYKIWSKIFPSANLQIWDLALLCTILTECCDLPHDIRLDINQLRKSRKKIFHMREPSIDDQKYQHYLMKLKVIFDRCLKNINNDVFTTEINQMFEDLKQGGISQDDVEEVMQKLQAMQEETNERFDELAQDQQSICTKLEELLRKIQVIETRLNPSDKIQIPESEVEILVRNCTIDEKDEISNRLVQYFAICMMEYTEDLSEISTSCHQKIKEAVRRTYKLLLSKVASFSEIPQSWKTEASKETLCNENYAEANIREVHLVQRTSDDSNEMTSGLRLSFINNSVEHRQHLKESFNNGEIESAMQNIQEAVADELKTTNIRITAHLIDQSTTSPGNTAERKRTSVGKKVNRVNIASVGTGRQSRICVILVKVGTRVARALFKKRVKDLTPTNHNPSPWTVDEFLSANKPKLRSLKLHSKIWSKIFPLAKLQTWDLALLCTILIECCDLQPDISLDINQMRKSHNKVFNMSEQSIDDQRYQRYLMKLNMIFDRCLNEINDEAFTTEINRMVKDIEHGNFTQEDVEDVKDVMQSMEENVYEIGQHQRATHEKLDDLLRKIDVSITSLESANKLKVPESGAKIHVLNCSSETEISELMMQCFEESLDRKDVDFSEGSLHVQAKCKDAVFKMYTKLLSKGYKVTGVEKGCVFLHVQCSSLASLMSYFRDYISGHLALELKEVEVAIRKLDGCQDIALEIVINTEEILETVNGIVSEFMKIEGTLTQKATGEIQAKGKTTETDCVDQCVKDDTAEFQSFTTSKKYQHSIRSNQHLYECTDHFTTKQRVYWMKAMEGLSATKEMELPLVTSTFMQVYENCTAGERGHIKKLFDMASYRGTYEQVFRVNGRQSGTDVRGVCCFGCRPLLGKPLWAHFKPSQIEWENIGDEMVEDFITCYSVTRDRNDLVHSSNNEISEKKMNEVFSNIFTFLKSNNLGQGNTTQVNTTLNELQQKKVSDDDDQMYKEV